MRNQHTFSVAILIAVTALLNMSGQALGQTRRDLPSRTARQGGSDTTEGQGNRCINRFDRFSNRNIVTIDPRTILSTGTDELRLGASAVVEEKGAASREIDLLFDSTTNRLRYGNSAEVRLIIDSKKVEGGTTYKIGGSAMRQANEKLRLTMSASRFLEIINGREVEMQIGETEVTLRREDLEHLRGFAICAGLKIKQQL